MYKCKECGLIFETPTKSYEDYTPSGGCEDSFICEKKVCPICKGTFEKINECEYCGKFITKEMTEYYKNQVVCEECKEELENNDES